MKEAIVLALKNNLSVRVAGTEVDELEGTRERRQASLLPRVTGDLLANRQNVNLTALGFSGHSLPAYTRGHPGFQPLRFPFFRQPTRDRP